MVELVFGDLAVVDIGVATVDDDDADFDATMVDDEDDDADDDADDDDGVRPLPPALTNDLPSFPLDDCFFSFVCAGLRLWFFFLCVGFPVSHGPYTTNRLDLAGTFFFSLTVSVTTRSLVFLFNPPCFFFFSSLSTTTRGPTDNLRKSPSNASMALIRESSDSRMREV